MITGLAVSVLLLHHHRRVAGRRAVNHDYAGALASIRVTTAPSLMDPEPRAYPFVGCAGVRRLTRFHDAESDWGHRQYRLYHLLQPPGRIA